MLTEDAKREITAAIADYPQPNGAAIDALMIVQRHHGWISDEHLCETARLLDMSVESLDGVATFYNQLFRAPVGRHVVQTCDGVMCWMLGQEEILATVRRLGMVLGQTSADGRFTWLPITCLGACHRAPAMLVDGELHEDLTAERVATILARYP